jgi:hypothetical protein
MSQQDDKGSCLDAGDINILESQPRVWPIKRPLSGMEESLSKKRKSSQRQPTDIQVRKIKSYLQRIYGTYLLDDIIESLQQQYGSVVDLASKRNECQESLKIKKPGGKGRPAGA